MNKTHLERALLALLIASLLVAGAAVAQSFLLTAGQGGTFDNPDGPAVTLGGDYGIAGDNPFGADGSVTIQDTTLAGPADSAVTLTDPSSAAPTLSSIDTGDGTVEADTDGIQTVGIEGSLTEVTYRDADLASTATEFEVTGSGTLYVHGLPANDGVRVQHANGGDTLVATNSSGVAAISIDSSTSFTLVADAGAPTLSDPSPTDGETQSSPPVDLSVNVTDGDFGAGDNVTLEWYVNGSLDGTTDVTSNGTVTHESSAVVGGAHDWYVEATDTTDATTRSPTTGSHSYSLPSTLQIYEETNPDEPIDTESGNVTVRFFSDGSDEVIDRSPTNGEIELEGLPTDEEFIVTIDAEGYQYRRIIVDSLIEQQDVFLLPDDAEAATVVFQLDDQTGRFDPVTTRLYVERALNQSGNTSYRVIAGDRFGASGEFPVELQDDERYRLRVENADGETRTLGAHTVAGDALAVLPIGQIDIDTSIQEGVAFGATISQDTQDGETTRAARLDYYDPSGETDVLELSVVRVDDGSETTVVEDTVTTPGTRHLGTYPLPADHPENATYEARFVAERNGVTIEGSERIGDVEEIAGDLGIDPVVLELLGFIAILAVAGLIAVVSPAVASLVAVAVAALLSVMGVVAIPTPAIGVAGVTAVLYNVARAKRVR